MPGVCVSETQCSPEKFRGWSQCFLSWQSQRAFPQWKVLDSSSAPVWENTHPTLSLLRHWCSMWKIKSVAHSALSPPSLYSNINMYDRVWWGRERLGEIGIAKEGRKGESLLPAAKFTGLFFNLYLSFFSTQINSFYMQHDILRSFREGLHVACDKNFDLEYWQDENSS